MKSNPKTCDWPACDHQAEPGGPGYAAGPDQSRTAELCRTHGSLWEQMVEGQRVDELRKLFAHLR